MLLLLSLLSIILYPLLTFVLNPLARLITLYPSVIHWHSSLSFKRALRVTDLPVLAGCCLR